MKIHITFIISKILKNKILGKSSSEDEKLLLRLKEENKLSDNIEKKCLSVNFARSFNKKQDEALSEVAYQKFMRKAALESKKRALFSVNSAAVLLTILFLGLLGFFSQQVVNDYRASKQFVNVEKINQAISHDSRAVLTHSSGKKQYLARNQETLRYEKEEANVREEGRAIKEASKAEIKYSTLKVLRGNQFHLLLSDGTNVWLNADSEISFPEKFAQSSRVVKVKGEVFFDVKRDVTRPFIVETPKSEIKVLGTAFNIRCYDDEEYSTTLVRGKVKINIGTESLILRPGEQCYESSNRIGVREVDVSECTSWVKGEFYFKDKSLAYILNELGRVYDKTVVFKDESIKTIIYSGGFKKYSNLKEITSMLESSGGIRIDINHRELVVTKVDK